MRSRVFKSSITAIQGKSKMKVESVKIVHLIRFLLQQITGPHALNLCAIQDISFHSLVIVNHVLFTKHP